MNLSFIVLYILIRIRYATGLWLHCAGSLGVTVPSPGRLGGYQCLPCVRLIYNKYMFLAH